jgi:hypothetical protein
MSAGEAGGAALARLGAGGCCLWVSFALACTGDGALTLALDPEWETAVAHVELVAAEPAGPSPDPARLLAREAQYGEGPLAEGWTRLYFQASTYDAAERRLTPPLKLGSLPPGATLAVRARGSDCSVLGQGWATIPHVRWGQTARVALRLEAPVSAWGCPEGQRCLGDGQCFDCNLDGAGCCLHDHNCQDENHVTTDFCDLSLSTGQCAHTPDFDDDGFSRPEDCDDTNASAYPQAEPRCDGVTAADHDCNGVLDDLDGCRDSGCSDVAGVGARVHVEAVNAHRVFGYGRRVVAAIARHDSDLFLGLWMGEIEAEGEQPLALEERAVVLAEEIGHHTPIELAVFNHVAYVMHFDGLAIFDMSAEPPRYLGQRLGANIAGGIEQFLFLGGQVVAPYLVVQSGKTHHFLDATRVDGGLLWPVRAGGVDLPAPAEMVRAFAVRDGMLYSSDSQTLYCGPLQLDFVIGPSLLNGDEGGQGCQPYRHPSELALDALAVIPDGRIIALWYDANQPDAERQLQVLSVSDGPQAGSLVMSQEMAVDLGPSAASPGARLSVQREFIVVADSSGVSVLLSGHLDRGVVLSIDDLPHGAAQAVVMERTLVIAAKEHGLVAARLDCR